MSEDKPYITVTTGSKIGGIMDPAIAGWRGNKYILDFKTMTTTVEPQNMVLASWADRDNFKDPEQQLVFSTWFDMDDYLKFRGI